MYPDPLLLELFTTLDIKYTEINYYLKNNIYTLITPVLNEHGMGTCKNKYSLYITERDIGFNRVNSYQKRTTHISSFVFYTVVYFILNELVNTHQHFDNTAPAAPRGNKILHDVNCSTTFPISILFRRTIHVHILILNF